VRDAPGSAQTPLSGPPDALMHVKALQRQMRYWLNEPPGPRAGREEEMRSDSNKLTESVFAIVMFATVAVLAMLALGEEIRTSGPSLGDIVTFSSASADQQSPLVLTAVRVGVPGGRACALDTKVMAASGGSIFVEAQSPAGPQGFRVHWAGGSTSADATDCGNNAELLLTAHQLEELAAVSGGFGVSPVRRADLQTKTPARMAAD
jgi:hypothetical protein